MKARDRKKKEIRGGGGLASNVNSTLHKMERADEQGVKWDTKSPTRAERKRRRQQRGPKMWDR